MEIQGKLGETWYDGDFLIVPITIEGNLFEYVFYVQSTPTVRMSARIVSFWVNELRKKVRYCFALVDWRNNIVKYEPVYGAPPRNFGYLFQRIVITQWDDAMDITFVADYTDIPVYTPSNKTAETSV